MERSRYILVSLVPNNREPKIVTTGLLTNFCEDTLVDTSQAFFDIEYGSIVHSIYIPHFFIKKIEMVLNDFRSITYWEPGEDQEENAGTMRRTTKFLSGLFKTMLNALGKDKITKFDYTGMPVFTGRSEPGTAINNTGSSFGGTRHTEGYKAKQSAGFVTQSKSPAVVEKVDKEPTIFSRKSTPPIREIIDKVRKELEKMEMPEYSVEMKAVKEAEPKKTTHTTYYSAGWQSGNNWHGHGGLRTCTYCSKKKTCTWYDGKTPKIGCHNFDEEKYNYYNDWMD